MAESKNQTEYLQLLKITFEHEVKLIVRYKGIVAGEYKADFAL